MILPMNGAASQIAAEGAGIRQTIKMTMLRQGMIVDPHPIGQLNIYAVCQEATTQADTELNLSSDL